MDQQLAGMFGGAAPLVWTRAVSDAGSASEAIAAAEREYPTAEDRPSGAGEPVGVSAYKQGELWAVVFMFEPG